MEGRISPSRRTLVYAEASATQPVAGVAVLSAQAVVPGGVTEEVHA